MEIYVAAVPDIFEAGIGTFVSTSKDKVIEEITKFLSYDESNKNHDKIRKIDIEPTENSGVEYYNIYFEANEDDETPDWSFTVVKTILILA